MEDFSRFGAWQQWDGSYCISKHQVNWGTSEQATEHYAWTFGPKDPWLVCGHNKQLFNTQFTSAFTMPRANQQQTRTNILCSQERSHKQSAYTSSKIHQAFLSVAEPSSFNINPQRGYSLVDFITFSNREQGNFITSQIMCLQTQRYPRPRLEAQLGSPWSPFQTWRFDVGHTSIRPDRV